MFYLQSVELFQYKNHYSSQLELDSKINVILGDNGSGKTNILDAVYNLCLTKSALSSQEVSCVMFGKDFYSLKGVFLKDSAKLVVTNSFKPNEGKSIHVNQSPVERLKNHIGRFPCVMVHPDDISIVKGGSEERRRFFDGTFGQSNVSFLEDLLFYQKLLKQRNALLKQFLERKYKDLALLETYTKQMIPVSERIFNHRKNMMQYFEPSFSKWYALLSGMQEKPELTYEAENFEADYEKLFKNCLNDDLRAGRTTLGIQTDEFHFFSNGMLVRKTGSQGQQKTFLLALKLAQYEFVSSQLSVTPILLLDDIFDKLDEKRSAVILNLIKEEKLGQTFITDAQIERTQKFIASKIKNPKIAYVKNGELSEIL
ncbi:MAG: DNA replication and repair protein RecF, partial [Cytophagales bacterium]